MALQIIGFVSRDQQLESADERSIADLAAYTRVYFISIVSGRDRKELTLRIFMHTREDEIKNVFKMRVEEDNFANTNLDICGLDIFSNVLFITF